MVAWNWWVIAALLLAAELFFIDAQFYLVFLGVAAALVGVGVTLVPLSPLVQWLGFAVLALALVVLFRKRLYQQLREPKDSVPESLSVGDRVTLPQTLGPGQTCRVEYRGTTWSARNIDSEPVSGEAIITHVEGLTLLVKQP